MTINSTRINSGSILATHDASGNPVYLATSDFERSPDDHPFLKFSTAAFYLGIVEARYQSKKRRMGEL